MNVEEIIAKTKEHLQAKALEITNPAPRRIFVTVDRSDLVETVRFLRDRLGFYHLATITGVDLGDQFELLYHLANSQANLNLRLRTPRSAPRVPSICAVIPGAILYERELQDMFGIVVENIPDPRPLLLADDWPRGQYPLRKDWKWERPPEVIPGGK